MGTWAHGHMGTWTHGHMGTWAQVIQKYNERSERPFANINWDSAFRLDHLQISAEVVHFAKTLCNFLPKSWIPQARKHCVLWQKGYTSAVIIAATDFSQRMSRCGPISFSYGTLCQAQLDIGKKYENWSSGKFWRSHIYKTGKKYIYLRINVNPSFAIKCKVDVLPIKFFEIRL